MMSRHLGAVGTKREMSFRWNAPSGAGLLRLAIFTAALAATGLAAVRANAQQGPQPQPASQAQSAPVAADAPHSSAAPLVTYEHGQLTIVAENASLSDVMAALHSAMGTEVDIPAVSASERVWVHLGPGSAHKILSDLFANTDLDYIVQGSATDAGAIRSVVLSVRIPDSGPSKNGPITSPVESAARKRFGSAPAAEPEPDAAPAQAPTPTAQEAASAAAPATSAMPAAPPAAADTASSDSAPAATAPPTDATSKVAEQAGMLPTGPSNVYPQTPQPSAGSFNPHPTPPPSMSTDQMVQQLTNMYQQRRQMQQGQANSTPN